MKAFTDIEQSKILATILPLESADMLFQLGEDKYADSIRVPLTKEYWEQMMPDINPCWSLATLTDILRKDFEVCIIGYEKAWKCHVTNRKTLVTDWLLADNPIDCCYGMILKLHELNLL